MRKLEKGDMVLGEWTSRRLPLAEVKEVYETVEGKRAIEIAYVLQHGTDLVAAENVVYVGDRHFIACETNVYRVSNGELVAVSANWARIISDLLENYHPEFPGNSESEPNIAHGDWRALNE